jgi:hypothetical protein
MKRWKSEIFLRLKERKTNRENLRVKKKIGDEMDDGLDVSKSVVEVTRNHQCKFYFIKLSDYPKRVHMTSRNQPYLKASLYRFLDKIPIFNEKKY